MVDVFVRKVGGWKKEMDQVNQGTFAESALCFVKHVKDMEYAKNAKGEAS